MPYLVIIVALTALISPDISSAEDPSQQSHSDTQSGLMDVYFLDLPCDINSTCEVSRPAHLVEYFGADWCEPCESLELFLNTLNFDDVALIQHHPSVLDQSYLNHSKEVFDKEYRLLFIPSLIVNSNSLLTGSTQGVELNQSLMITDSGFAGLENISVENGILFWNTSTEYNLTIWKLEQTEHEYDNRTLPYLAVERVTLTNDNRQYDISLWLNHSGGRLVFILQDDIYPKPLESISTSPTGDKFLSDGVQDNNQLFAHNGSYELAIITFVILFLALLPALLSFRNLQKQGIDEAE